MQKFYDEVVAIITANPSLTDIEICTTLLSVVAQTVESISSLKLRHETAEAIQYTLAEMLEDAMQRAALADVHGDRISETQ